MKSDGDEIEAHCANNFLDPDAADKFRGVRKEH